MSVERDVGDMLVFISNNKDRGRAVLISEKIFNICDRHGIENVLENLNDRSGTPLILWTIYIIKSLINELRKEQV